jgi:hypothetical protein
MNLLPEHTLMFRDHRSNQQYMEFFRSYFKQLNEALNQAAAA